MENEQHELVDRIAKDLEDMGRPLTSDLINRLKSDRHFLITWTHEQSVGARKHLDITLEVIRGGGKITS